MKTISAKKLPEHPLWRYSLRVYSAPEVAFSLLKLQDKYNLNVNMLLFSAWYASTGQGRLSQSQIRELLRSIAPWHERVVAPLRRIRRRLSVSNKVWAQTIRKDILNEELEAEHIEQTLLMETHLIPPQRYRSLRQQLSDAGNNILTYCRQMQIMLTLEDTQQLNPLLRATFPDHDPALFEELSERIVKRGKQSILRQGQQQLPLDLL